MHWPNGGIARKLPALGRESSMHGERAMATKACLLACLLSKSPKMNHPASDLVGPPAGLVALATMHGLRAGCIWRYTFVHVGRLR